MNGLQVICMYLWQFLFLFSFTQIYVPFSIDISGSLDIQGNATISEYLILLQSVAFVNLNQNISTEDRLIEFRVTDGSGATSDSEFLNITILPFDDPPICFSDISVSSFNIFVPAFCFKLISSPALQLWKLKFRGI